MKTNCYYKPETLTKAIYYAFCLSFIILLGSCKKDSGMNGHFELKNNPSAVEAPASGFTETYTFSASGAWKIEALRKENWVKIEPSEGNGDGTFTLTVVRNTTPEARSTALVFSVDGKLQSEVLHITQQSGSTQGEVSDPYLNFDGKPASLEFTEAAITSNHIIRSTGKWKVELEDEVDWISIAPMEGVGDVPVTLTINKNTGVDRAVNLRFYLDDVLQPNPFPIRQAGVSVVTILEEDFSWLTYGNTIFNTTDGETRIGLWNANELAKGWTSTINPTTGGGNYASIYARPGFIKLGRTNYGGDLISPKLSEITGTKNVKVAFKAAVYMTAGGNVDHNLLKVGVKGPGTVSVSDFFISNKPDYVNDPNCIEVWKKPEALQTFVITGATAETQVWFLGGAFDIRAESGWPKNVNRIFLDDIVVTLEQ